MEVFVRALRGAATPEQVLRALAVRSRRLGLPAPAALTGDWFGGSAVLAPSVAVGPRSDPLAALDTVRPSATSDIAPPGAGPTVGGGWVGFLGYPGDRGRPQEAAWGWTDHVLRRDAGGQWWFESLGEAETALVAELAALVESGALADAATARTSWSAGPVVAPDADQHRKAVRRCVDEITAGEIFQANICTRFSMPFAGDPLEVFARGSERLRPARAAYVSGAWGAIASLSPELFLARRGRSVRSSPIKGTLPRRGPADDGNAELLRSSVKDVAENVMIVDMVRNDLGRVAAVGGVTVPRLLDVQPHPGVWHLVSDVLADVPGHVPHSALLEAAFPPASVTGAPKPRALEIIAELESHPRDVYCGAVGMVSPLAGLELNVAIRTLEFADGGLRLGVGGGITADSDPEREWQECLTKAAPLLDLLAQRRDSSTAS